MEDQEEDLEGEVLIMDNEEGEDDQADINENFTSKTAGELKKRKTHLDRMITKKDDALTGNDEGEVVVNSEGENDSQKSPDTAPKRIGISNIARSLTLKKKIMFKEKPIKWTDRIALRQSRTFKLEMAQASREANNDNSEKKQKSPPKSRH